MKYVELSKMKKTELSTLLVDLKTKLAIEKLKKFTIGLDKPHLSKVFKRQIAQVKMLLSTKV